MSRRLNTSPSFVVETTSKYAYGYNDEFIQSNVSVQNSATPNQSGDEEDIEEVVIYDGGDVNGFG